MKKLLVTSLIFSIGAILVMAQNKPDSFGTVSKELSIKGQCDSAQEFNPSSKAVIITQPDCTKITINTSDVSAVRGTASQKKQSINESIKESIGMDCDLELDQNSEPTNVICYSSR